MLAEGSQKGQKSQRRKVVAWSWQEQGNDKYVFHKNPLTFIPDVTSSFTWTSRKKEDVVWFYLVDERKDSFSDKLLPAPPISFAHIISKQHPLGFTHIFFYSLILTLGESLWHSG